MTFASSSERPEMARRLLVAIARSPKSRLSWDSFECAPHPTCLVCVHPSDVAAAFGRPVPTGLRVPSSWFLTTSTVYSALEVPGLLHPGTGRGSPRF